MVADVYIKEELFERFRGDGLAISTPTGSTAYNKSVGGAVVHPSINAMQLAEIASLNNQYSVLWVRQVSLVPMNGSMCG